MDTVDDCELNIGHLSVTELTPAVSRQCCITTSNDQLGLKKRPIGSMSGGGEPACKPGSVEGDHSSWSHVTVWLSRPTRIRCGPHHWIPIWSCSRWGLPCRSCYHERGALLPHHFTLTAQQVFTCRTGGIFSVALSIDSRRPDVIWHPALWSPDFPPPRTAKHQILVSAGTKPRSPGRLPM